MGARELIGALPWAGLSIGVVLVFAGLAVLFGRHLRLGLPGLPVRRGGLTISCFPVGFGGASIEEF